MTEPYIIIDATGVVPQPNNDPSDQLPGLLDPGKEMNGGRGYEPMPVGAGNVSNFQESLINPQTTAVDWDAQKEALRPGTIPEDAWDAIWVNFRAVVGSTLADLFTLLRDDQAQLVQSGVSTNSITRLTNFEIQKANNMPPLLAMDSPVDAALPAWACRSSSRGASDRRSPDATISARWTRMDR